MLNKNKKIVYVNLLLIGIYLLTRFKTNLNIGINLLFIVIAFPIIVLTIGRSKSTLKLMLLFTAFWSLVLYLFSVGLWFEYPIHNHNIAVYLNTIEGLNRHEMIEKTLIESNIDYNINQGSNFNNMDLANYDRLCNTEIATEIYAREMITFLENIETDAEWLLVLESDAEPLVKDLMYYLNVIIDKATGDTDVIWLDLRNYGSYFGFGYGGTAGILFKVSSLQQMSKNMLNIICITSNKSPGFDSILRDLCTDGTLRCYYWPLIRENGSKSILGLFSERPFLTQTYDNFVVV